jgi:hypothetical protein
VDFCTDDTWAFNPWTRLSIRLFQNWFRTRTLWWFAWDFDSTNEGEGYNRTFQLPLDQDDLIKTALGQQQERDRGHHFGRR